MGTFNPSPERKPSESRVSQASAEHTGWRDKGRRPMFDTLAVTKELQESGLASPQAEAIVAAFGTIAGNVATKDDLEGFATKDDLRAIEKKMATKDDLKNFATKDDLKNFATKDDLKHLVTEASLLKAIGESSEKIHRSLLQVAMGTITVNIAMVTAIFVVAKYLF